MSQTCPHCGAEVPGGDFMCPSCRVVIPNDIPRRRRPRSLFTPLPDRLERAFIPLGGCRDVVLLMVALVLLLLFAACGSPVQEAGPSPTPTGTPFPTPDGDTVEISFGDAAVTAEVADEHEERLIGLMNRRSLGADAGMLFKFEAKTSGGFWMKNTLIPLSIAYMSETDEGYEVLVILDMEPCRKDPCPDYPPGQQYDAALEVNEGWFDRHGVEAGDKATVSE